MVNLLQSTHFLPESNVLPQDRLSKPSKKKQKELVERGQERVTKTGRTIPAKKFFAQHYCKCSRSCSVQIDVLGQRQIFDTYYAMNWTAKTFFLRSCVKTTPVKHHISDNNPIILDKMKQHSSSFYLKDENRFSSCADLHF